MPGLNETKKQVEGYVCKCLLIEADLQKKDDVKRIGIETLEYTD